MINFSALKKFNTTDERLKEIFSITESDIKNADKPEVREQMVKDRKAAKWLSEVMWGRVLEGAEVMLKNHSLYTAVDLAWDTHPITHSTVPLMLFAQGRIDIETTAKQLEASPTTAKFVTRKTVENTPRVEIDLPRFIETHCNLTKALVTRKLTGLARLHSDLFPYYKYEGRITSWPWRLRADVMSQLADIQADQFGAREHAVEAERDALLYAHAIDFVTEKWTVERQVLSDAKLGGDAKEDFDAKIVKQGVDWTLPHPTRTYYDTSRPLSKLNTNTGPRWVGHWEIVRFGDIAFNPAFINRGSIANGEKFWGAQGLYAQFASYFSTAYTTVATPRTGALVAGNEREAGMGVSSQSILDTPVLICNHYEYLIPSEVGLGNYPYPVWIRFVMAGDGTVIFPEILPSTPGAYLGFNESGKRLFNTSLAHAIMPYQDQMTNLLTQLMLLCQAELLKIIILNEDVITDKRHIEEIKGRLSGENWSGKPIVIQGSFSKISETLQDPQVVNKIVQLAETKVSGSIQAIISAMIQLINLCERLEGVSPNEQAQPNPREVSATEVNTISASVGQGISFYGDAVDSYRAAKKRIIYESTIACHEGKFTVPVIGRYADKTIKAAGFERVSDEGGVASDGLNVIGSPQDLVGEYIFTTRDGSDRMPNSQAANVLVQLLQQLLAVPMVAEAMGKEKVFDIINEVARLTTAIDLGLGVGETDDKQFVQSNVAELTKGITDLQGIIQQIVQKIQECEQRIVGQEGVNTEQEKSLKLVAELSRQVGILTSKVGEHAKQLAEPPEIPYRDAPPDVQRQMEKAAGWQPSTLTAEKTKTGDNK